MTFPPLVMLALDTPTNSTSPTAFGIAGTTVLAVLDVAVIATIAWLVSQLLSRVITRGARRAGVPPRVVSYIRVALNAAWIMVTVAVVLSISALAPYLSGALTISGLVALAISLALQTTFSNMIAGILLFQDNILRIGDEIQFGGVRGRVVRTWLRSTWIQAEDGTIVIVSNNNLSAGPLINYTATVRLMKRLDDLPNKKV